MFLKIKPRIQFFSLLILLAVVAGCKAKSSDSNKGLWLTERKFPLNHSRCEIPGNIKDAPNEVWSYGHRNKNIVFGSQIEINGQKAYLAANGTNLYLYDKDGKSLWDRPFLGFSQFIGFLENKKAPRILVSQYSDTVILIDANNGRKLWSWTVPEGTRAFFHPKIQRLGDKNRLFIFPVGVVNGTYGYCFEFSPDQTKPKILWRRDYKGKYYDNFGPSYVLADMDNDGKEEIVAASKPTWIGVIDTDTGEIKFDLKYEITDAPVENIGRPYGLLHVADFDGDGYKDVIMVSSQVEEYIGVLQNINGKSFKFLWSQFIEQDFPENDIELRPETTSIVDINGDGKKELVVGLYNMTGDKKWHTIVIDLMKGFNSRLFDFEDRYFWGCHDLDLDGRVEIITSVVSDRRLDKFTTIEAIDTITGKAITSIEKSALKTSTWNTTGPDQKRTVLVTYQGVMNRAMEVSAPDGSTGLLIEQQGARKCWQIKKGRSVLTPVTLSTLGYAILAHNYADKDIPFDIKIQYDEPYGTGPTVLSSLVSIHNGQRELIIALGGSKIIGVVPDMKKSGKFKSKWEIPGTKPAVWLGNDGRRVVCSLDTAKDIITLSVPDPQKDTKIISKIKLPMEATGRIPLLPFTDSGEFRFLAAMHIGPHTLSSALYDEKANQLWLDKKHGPHRQPAIADIDGDGKTEIVVDDHGQHFIYQEDGSRKIFSAAWNTIVPDRGDGAAYAIPIIGPFGPDGQTRILMSPGLEALEVVDVNGERLLKEDYAPDIYMFNRAMSAVAKIRSDDKWDIGMIDSDGIFHCAALETCKDRWTLDLGTRLFGWNRAPVVSCDIDGDGRDNFILGLPNGELVALDENQKTGKGIVLWKKLFNSAINHCIAADIDGDGLAEIIVTTADGFVRILK